MTKIRTERQYEATCERIEELLEIVGNDTPADDKNFIELDLISDLVVDYEKEHFFVKQLVLVDTVKPHKYEMKTNSNKHRLQTKRAVPAPTTSVRRVVGLM